MKRLILALSAAAVFCAFTASVQAATVTYQLGDHPDAALYVAGGDPYGLRYDNAAPPGEGPTFSVATNLGGAGGPVTLSWDPLNLAAGATLTGTLDRNDDGTSWTATYNLTGLAAAPNGGFTALDGTGSVDEIGGALRSIALDGKVDISGFAFIFDNDGHRLGPGGSDAADGWVGRGWLEPSILLDDWLVTAQVIPVPAAVWLFGSALGLMGLARRRRS